MRKFTVREGRFENPNPVLLTDLYAIQTSQQYTAHLLCQDCEQRFNANGENWVLKHCWRGTDFPLASLVASGKAVLTSPELSVYSADEITGVNVSALTYFSASMFWRAAVHNWSGRAVEPLIHFGRYAEELRNYLSGEVEFPRDCILLVTLPQHDSDPPKWMLYPFPKRTHGCHVYTMLFLGIGLSLSIGRQISTDRRGAALIRRS